MQLDRLSTGAGADWNECSGLKCVMAFWLKYRRFIAGACLSPNFQQQS